MGTIKIISENKNLLVTIGVVLACLFLYSIFPTSNIFQDVVSSLTFLFIIPALYIKIIQKATFKNFGIQFGNKQKGFAWMSISLVMAVLLLYAIFNYTSFSQGYHPPQIIADQFVFFVLYEFFIVGLFVSLYEFFFRGFVMLGIGKELGLWSVVAQFALFFGFFWITGNLNWSSALYIIITPFAGITAYQSRSLIYSFGTSLLFIIIADAIIIGLTKT
jgi:membrane protease YdiL (CAAX protease family)